MPLKYSALIYFYGTHASQLSGISLEAPKQIIGKNTVDCMKSGVIYSSASAMDGIIDRMEEALGEKAGGAV